MKTALALLLLLPLTAAAAEAPPQCVLPPPPKGSRCGCDGPGNCICGGTYTGGCQCPACDGRQAVLPKAVKKVTATGKVYGGRDGCSLFVYGDPNYPKAPTQLWHLAFPGACDDGDALQGAVLRVTNTDRDVTVTGTTDPEDSHYVPRLLVESVKEGKPEAKKGKACGCLHGKECDCPSSWPNPCGCGDECGCLGSVSGGTKGCTAHPEGKAEPKPGLGKRCTCSSACTCGCNQGEPCNKATCHETSGPAVQQMPVAAPAFASSVFYAPAPVQGPVMNWGVPQGNWGGGFRGAVRGGGGGACVGRA